MWSTWRDILTRRRASLARRLNNSIFHRQWASVGAFDMSNSSSFHHRTSPALSLAHTRHVTFATSYIYFNNEKWKVLSEGYTYWADRLLWDKFSLIGAVDCVAHRFYGIPFSVGIRPIWPACPLPSSERERQSSIAAVGRMNNIKIQISLNRQ